MAAECGKFQQTVTMQLYVIYENYLKGVSKKRKQKTEKGESYPLQKGGLSFNFT